MFPVRLSFVTYNLWNTVRWPLRAPALQHFVECFQPDIFCVQELRAETQTFLDQVMPKHTRVHDPFPGWTCEGNIYWQHDLLEAVTHGAEDIGILETERRLFWVRLRVKASARTLLVSTAHFTYPLHPQESDTGLSPRVEQTRRTITALQRLVQDTEPAFFMGDLNDPLHPTRLLHAAGYQSCFTALGLLCPPTFPCAPTAHMPAGASGLTLTVDWIMANHHARVVAAQVPQCYHGDVGPSDHWPVLAVYEV
jgi:exonuclease III